MKLLAIIAAVALTTPAYAESFFIEQAAVLAVYRDVCHQPVSDDTLGMLLGAAMIKQALPGKTVFARATRRGSQIRTHVLKSKTQNTFCLAIKYYLEHGYPK